MLIQYKTTKSRRNVSDRIGQALIDRGIAQLYQTREMRAATVTPLAESAPVQYTRSEPVEAAPYGYKADGTPRARPGRPAKAE